MEQQVEQQESQSVRICRRMDAIGRKILIMSNKGGVGKTTVTVKLAQALVRAGFRVGILDTDIHGPNVARMTGCENEILKGSEHDIEPVITEDNLKIVSISFALENPEDAVIFRGPMKLSVIKQFLSDVNWGELDYLLIDTPPGTGDEQLAVAQNIPALAGCLIVTTPHDVSLLDSARSVSFARQLNLKILGVVENMSGLICPHCGERIDVFGTGGAERLCTAESVPLLGRIPLFAGKSEEDGCFDSLAQLIHSQTKPLTSADIGYSPVSDECSPASCAGCTSDCPSKNRGGTDGR